ncbi:MAG: hypothetical protein JW995_00205 [Melioribacteraceae bacterium]|nr:hypothetical protein [Melioribacteraceae bacterium]
MSQLHDFSSPRNLYEKLLRDAQRLSSDITGDNIFNFVSTAFHLQHWIKNSPLVGSEVMKRILRRISSSEYIKHCQNIARAKEHFKIQIKSDVTADLIIGDEKVDLHHFKEEILELYSNYFKVK